MPSIWQRAIAEAVSCRPCGAAVYWLADDELRIFKEKRTALLLAHSQV